MQELRENILSILVDVATVTHSHMLNVVSFHGEPIVADSHDFLDQQRSTGIGFNKALMHLFHQMASLEGIYASKQSCIVVPLIQDFPTQEELRHHAPNKFPLTIHGSGQVFTIFDISLDIMISWLPIDFSFDAHAFFNVHAVGRRRALCTIVASHLLLPT